MFNLKTLASSHSNGPDTKGSGPGRISFADHSDEEVALAPPGKRQRPSTGSRLDRIAQTSKQDVSAAHYAYDEVYDQMKQAKKQAYESAQAATQAQAIHVNGMLASAAQRNLDKLNAEQRKHAHQRKLDGDAFGGVESFVTEAYRQKLAEMEAESQAQILEAQNKKESASATGFMYDMQKKQDAIHQAAVEAGQKKAEPVESIDLPAFDVLSQAEAIRLAQAAGEDVEFDENGQLLGDVSGLKAGLNINKTRAPAPIAAQKVSIQHRSTFNGPEHWARRARQSAMIEEQLLALESKVDVPPAPIVVATDPEKISDAKRRYMERKALKDKAT